MRKRFILTVVTLVVIAVAASIAVLLAKGYRFSPQKGTISGTGILSITSAPDQASVYLDGHLTTATNANVNSLVPKQYDVKIVKEGFIPWEKKVDVKEGLVTEIKATLFRAIPTVYPLTYTGVRNPLISPDGQKLAYVVPGNDKKSGVWVWTMLDKTLAFGRGSEPHQVTTALGGTDYTKAVLKWSPDSRQILVNFPGIQLLLEADRMNDTPRDITATIGPALKGWEDDQKAKDLARLDFINDPALKKIASASAVLKWSPDETKILYSQNGKKDFKVTDLTLNKTYDIPQATSYNWLADSDHLVLTESSDQQVNVKPQEEGLPATFPLSKISVIESDGFNKSEIYGGNFNPLAVFPWPDGSRLVIISSLPTATASEPNLFGVNLK